MEARGAGCGHRGQGRLRTGAPPWIASRVVTGIRFV
jgi:hypothetical protein